MMFENKKIKIAIIGLGYVGLPLLNEFANKYHATGFDTNSKRIDDLKNLHDQTLEVKKKDLTKLKNIIFSKSDCLQDQDFFIVTVPTPIKKNKEPDTRSLRSACKLIGKYLSKGNHVIFESTVYPGLTEEICIPILENESSLLVNKDFSVGYSPERINPGDPNRRLTDIVKITAPQILGLSKS